MRELIEDELRFSASIILGGEEIVPRFRVEMPDGTALVVFVPLPEDGSERRWRLGMVSAFMAWKGAVGFVMSTELKEPDGVVAVGVTREAVIGGLRLIARKPLMLSPVQWLERVAIGDDIPDLMPPREALLSDDMMRDLVRVFGPQGEFRVEQAVQ